MTEETARSPRPEATRPGVPPPTAGGPTPSAPPPPPAAGRTGPTAAPPYDQPPAPGGAGFTSRYGLVRPRAGRYLAGVCAAIGRATNTDPVLWRVLLAVLGFFGGVGILVYVSAWLIIPGEGDSASPIESMLGRGRSSMSPVTVIMLSILVAISFGYIVTDAFRAVLLGAAILIGGALLLNRDHPARDHGDGTPHPTGPPLAYPPGPVPPVSYPAPGPVTAATPPAPAPFGPAAPPAGDGTGPFRPSAPVAPGAGTQAGGLPGWPAPAGPTPSTGPVTTTATPPGYRPPFAPHGPYAGPGQHGPYAGPGPVPAAPPGPPVRPPKRPREHSPLGPITFSLVFLACGVVAVLDLLGVIQVSASAYFAAALATIGLGLVVGTWFGRARWLIALGLVTAAALGFATAAESFADWRPVNGNVTWAPATYPDLAPRYQHSFGDALLDLRAVDFSQHNAATTVVTTVGDATVLLPPDVDVTVQAEVNAGEATLFGSRSDGPRRQVRQVTDLGADGAGGGSLRLIIRVTAGTLEVTR
ncbi:PspC domain-containing protein [Micromonospora cathayae]|uniref:PspC domain-containing protein n=1 Tax=Micromonospora cathayae TaxID=3028804 RepID=A0ABY7ZTX4_9ACTN|nr:PspC domain-containing protein [Micromonospora sp. HUAS 3]WDZ85254.1 PspC domain-containing protein [Micromonospora sp. HUAS 3]